MPSDPVTTPARTPRPSAGGTLIALAVIGPVIGRIVLLRAKNVIRAGVRTEQEQQRAVVDRIIG